MDKAGMLIKGFEKKNTMITLYNHSYYKDHMKQHGYKKLAEWVEYDNSTAERFKSKKESFAAFTFK